MKCIDKRLALLLIIFLVFLECGLSQKFLQGSINEMDIEGKETNIAVSNIQVSFFSKWESYTSLSDDQGKYTVRYPIDTPLFVFYHGKDYIPQLIKITRLINEKHVYLESKNIFKQRNKNTQGNLNDTTYRIVFTVVDKDTRQPILGAASYVIGLPYFAVSNMQGKIKLNTPDVELISDSIVFVLDAKEYIPYKFTILKSELIKHKTIKYSDIKLTSVMLNMN